MPQIKTCTRCDKTLPIEQFYADKRKPDGKRYDCGPCNLNFNKDKYHRKLKAAGQTSRRYSKGDSERIDHDTNAQR